MADTNIYTRLAEIQRTLKAPKNKRNTFGNYSYRSAEDILESVKPLLKDCVLNLSDEIVEVGGRIYIKATATLVNGNGSVNVTAFAREEESKKGMDSAQVTGSASSYARKYALNGLFAIDDNKDPDTEEYQRQQTNVSVSIDNVIAEVINAKDANELTRVWKKYSAMFAKDGEEYNKLKKAVQESPVNPKRK